MTLSSKFRGGVGRLPVASLFLALLAVGVALAPALVERLQYQRSAIEAGELWRLLTCHFTHWSAEHLALDALVLLGLGAACEGLGRVRFLLTLLASAMVIPIALWWLEPGLVTYRGLSGLDAALWVLLAESLRRRARSRGVRLVFTLAPFMLLGKVFYEVATTSTLFISSPGPGVVVVPLAHLLGGLVGYFAAAGARRGSGRNRSEPLTRLLGGLR